MHFHCKVGRIPKLTSCILQQAARLVPMRRYGTRDQLVLKKPSLLLLAGRQAHCTSFHSPGWMQISLGSRGSLSPKLAFLRFPYA